MSQPIFDRLKALRGLPALKQLLYEDLGYPRANQILSTRDWPTALTEKLAPRTPPLILVEIKSFNVIYIQLKEGLERSPQREIIEKIANDSYGLFIFSDNEQAHWHFVQVKHEGIGKRSVLRRMAVDYGNDHRTVAERLALLDYSVLEHDLFGVSALALQAALTKAFDVEAVSKKFFEDYRRLFEAVEQAVPVLAAEPRRLFVQKLFNRLMFLMFVERKGWLHFNGRSDYLRALWEDYQRSSAHGTTTFYADRLQILFFHGLNRMPNAPDTLSDYDRERLIGQVPYLNGGLFEHDDDDTNPLITIPDMVFDRIIHELFYRYNWTVTESTPLDVEVAVDPEMLGRVFEELVTGRHESGSYYTPKPIVSFMELKVYSPKNYHFRTYERKISFLDWNQK